MRRSADDNYKFDTLITNIVLSDAFLKAKVPEVKETPSTLAAVAN